MGGPTSAARDQNAEDLLLTGFDVMHRRARGEQITVAQNLFERDPTGPVVRAAWPRATPSRRRGSSWPRPSRVGRASKIEIVEPAKPAARAT